MNEGRIGFVRKIERFNHQYVDSLNYLLKVHGDVEAKIISLDQMSSSTKYSKSISAIQDAAVRKRVLLRHLRKDRDTTETCDSPYGCYGGKSLESYTPDIDRYMEELHSPEIRRYKKAQKLKKDGAERGAIITHSGVQRKVDSYFTKHWSDNEDGLSAKETDELEEDQSKDIFEGTRHIKPPIRGLLPQIVAIPSGNAKETSTVVEENNDLKSSDMEINRTAYVPNIRLVQQKSKIKKRRKKVTELSIEQNKQKIVLPSIFLKKTALGKPSIR